MTIPMRLIRFWRIGLKVKNSKRTFSKYFYNELILKRAIKDYQSIAKISLCEKTDAFECSFDSDNIPVELVINEFNNYLIELLNGTEK